MCFCASVGSIMRPVSLENCANMKQIEYVCRGTSIERIGRGIYQQILSTTRYCTLFATKLEDFVAVARVYSFLRFSKEFRRMWYLPFGVSALVDSFLLTLTESCQKET